ncbi:MAG: DNA mismatch repair endonuclease MutL [Bacteroidales bacterium]
MLKVLPSYISNLIAAGEVVQRPASVVKELMENAVDAGATSIVVIINDCGRTLIQVIDNGCGITKQDAALAFERHATSKIEKAEDLYSINTYGFRGEALASIAACSDVTLKTRKEGEECGTEVHIAESNIISITETACQVGCNFAARNIFYNIPARRKFLKSDNVEYRQIVSEFIRIALTRLNIEFRLIHNSKDIFHISPVQNIKQRIIQIGGKDIAKDLVDIQTDTSVISIRGFIGRPEFAKKNQPNQYLFVNGRFFKSPALHKAIIKAYTNLIPDSTSPSYFIFLNIEPQNLDVNIHPAKTEIKFENEGVIFEILNAAVKESIGGNSFVPGIDFDTEGAPEMPVIATGFENRYVAPPKINYDPLFNPFEEEKKIGNSKWNSSGEWETNSFGQADAWEKGEKENEIDEKGYPGVLNEETCGSRPILQLHGRYIITPVKSGLLIIDIYKAKERILYERYLNSITNTTPVIQENLFPQTIDLDHNSYSILIDKAPILKLLGFDIRSFGKDCIVVYGIPDTLSHQQLSINECIDSLIADLTDVGRNFEQEFREKVALNMVKHSGIYSNKNINNNIQSQELVDALFACKEPYTAPNGGKCMTIIPLEELIKKL